jgi:hypothetical protein
MKKLGMAALAALTIAGTVAAGTTGAEARYYGRGGYHGGYHRGGYGIGAGIATGLALGAIGGALLRWLWLRARVRVLQQRLHPSPRRWLHAYGRPIIRPVNVCY